MTGNGQPPALVRSPADIDEFYLEDASPANEGSQIPMNTSERFIHQGLLKRFPSLQSVVHSHSRSVIPFGHRRCSISAYLSLGRRLYRAVSSSSGPYSYTSNSVDLDKKARKHSSSKSRTITHPTIPKTYLPTNLASGKPWQTPS